MTEAWAFPGAASPTTGEVDAVFIFIAAVSLFFFLLVEGMLVYFAVRYRRRRGEPGEASSEVKEHPLLETIWVIIPSVVVLGFFIYGYLVFRDLKSPLAGATDIHVVARQFLFEFKYPDGRKALNELRVPVGRPVKLIMTSDDVIHSFYVPDYRIKEDVFPGRYTYLYLRPDREGSYDVYCAEYCGVGHSTMRAKIVVMADKEYSAWAAAQAVEGPPTAERGKELLESSGCLNCHAVEGPVKVGPNLKGIFGREVTLATGEEVAADEEYLRESIVDPAAKVVKGFQPVMPTFKGTLSDADVAAIIAYLKVLSGAAAPEGAVEKKEKKEKEERQEKEEREEKEKPGKTEEKEKREGRAAAPGKGRELLERSGCLGCHSVDGSRKECPTFKGLYGRSVTLEGGGTAVADDRYLREAIVDPGARIVQGYPNMMPSFRGTLSDADVAAIIAHLKTLR